MYTLLIQNYLWAVCQTGGSPTKGKNIFDALCPNGTLHLNHETNVDHMKHR